MSEQPNPLLQPVVINILLEHVPKSMWNTCRLVCKPWHDELLPRWRKLMNVRIGGLVINKLKNVGKDDDLFMEVPSFLSTYLPKDIRQLEKYPFRSVKTIPGEVTIGGSRREIVFQNKFWNLCGPWLHELHFHGVMFEDMDLLKDVIFRLTPNLKQLEFIGCDVSKNIEVKKDDPNALKSYTPGTVQPQPNLKILKIKLEVHCNNYIEGYCTRSFGTIPLNLLTMFSVFTNIEDFCLGEFISGDIREVFIKYFLDVLKTIRDANQNSSVLNISKLDLKDLHIEFTPDLVTRLCSLSLPLEELHINVSGIVNDVQRLLANHAALTKLVLTNCKYGIGLNKFTLQLDVLSQTLRELHLAGYIFEDWSFLAFTPHLTKLVVDNKWTCNYIQAPENFPGNKTPLLECLTTFHYKFGDVLPFELIQMFTKIMPNVKKLTLNVDNAGFEMVCNAWPELTYWKINFADMKESTFIENVNKLKSLRCFEVNVAADRANGREIMNEFGNRSIQNGFLMIPKLERLCITFPYGISEVLLKDLYKKIEDTKKVYVANKIQKEKYPLINIAGNGCEKPIQIFEGCCDWC